MTENIKILIVEDTPAVAESITLIIQHIWIENVDIQLARNGEEGLFKSLAYQPDVIITDMEMPKMHGGEMVRLLRQERVGRNIPIVGMTGGDLGELSIVDNLGLFDAFMIKPFAWTELRDKLLILCPKLNPVQADNPA